ncbi:MAG: XRE family transcriptional regulator, partial [Hydrogeniiclostridium mannosilyticum]
MDYILKQFDEPLVKFSATTDTSEPEIQILWTNEEKAAFLPLDLTLTPDGMSRWLRRRTIPKNRAYVHNLLAKCGLNLNRPLSIISICKGLSLNDCYWVVEDGDAIPFDKVNLYDNPFSNVLAELAFTGYGSSIRPSLFSSPEFTTNGMLRKCWRRVGGKVYLYKGGTEGAANT